ncbi:MAG: 16S rRNA (adenine(1518)-N(6)/adenine(1519)-N(6))-dimethyltransferase RsmA [Opitutaceae bacterium]|jgi:16S rRNA (adenine1518-N6/adenine1519-N6)-dimethyltransferase|nr:16S rRNA (adenine(1518)-N(6)/adenine(1519)-N(6))-dimethyltransferase RsmA [Opitutaceae bacterium]
MPLTASETRDALAKLGVHPKHALGQNFLIDGNIVRKSLELAKVAPGDRVVEVGPGLGTLTRTLLEAGAEVWAVERDAMLARYLSEEVAPLHAGRLHLLVADAMDHPIADIPDPLTRPFKVVANLPYAISTPWMDAVLEGPLPERLVLMLQYEAAQRYMARPGSKLFGSISIFLQSAFDLAPGHKVSGHCFHPRPDVDSYLFNIVRKPQPLLFPRRSKMAIRACFQQRRKQIGTLLRGLLPDGGRAWIDSLVAAGLSPTVRPEDIPLHLWQTFPSLGASASEPAADSAPASPSA